MTSSHNETALGGRIYDNITQTIGNTPLVRLNRLAQQHHAKATILAKLEFFNPLSSIKDRIALSMIEEAEASGKLKKNTVIVEPTSGNTGIALAFVCASRGYKLILTMPESMSLERRKMLKFLGASLELTPAAKGMRGAIEKASEIVENNPNAIMLQQFQNPANPAAHIRSTAQEIWRDTGGVVDGFISGVGTGGTITGVGTFLKQHNPKVKIFAVEPEDSPVLSGGVAGAHKIQGIGAGFIPDVLDRTMIDEIMRISNQEAFDIARSAAILEGIPAGISSGATLAAALHIAARKDMAGKTLVVIVASIAERYISTDLFAPF
ncbi:MAG: cysteine synthase A [Alphaproteobacteria bacterium]|nr:MAG: cysteine synthase A [Alphaproteobacteria bacterium]